jgi:hypothetical protein
VVRRFPLYALNRLEQGLVVLFEAACVHIALGVRARVVVEQPPRLLDVVAAGVHFELASPKSIYVALV